MNLISAGCARMITWHTVQNDGRADDPSYEHGGAGVSQGCPWKTGGKTKREMDWPIKVGCDGPPNEMLCTVSVRCGGLQDDDGI